MKKYYMVESGSNLDLCPICQSKLGSCHVGVYCSNHECEGSYCDGLAYLDSKQAKKFKKIIIKKGRK